MAKKKNWYGDTHAQQLQMGETFSLTMGNQGLALNMSEAYIAAFALLTEEVRVLFDKVKDKTATGDEKITFRLKLNELIKLLQNTRKVYIDPAGLSDVDWAAWGLDPRKLKPVKAARIFTALTVEHQYIRGDVGMVIFTFVPIGSKGWGKENYCDAFEMFFGEFQQDLPVPSTTAEIMLLPGHEIVRTGRPKLNLERYRGKNLMVFVRMINANPVPGPFNDPPDMVRIT
ncbi:hypothetical protein ACYULU_15000 [Breznakiellaceae bacterium SP9]